MITASRAHMARVMESVKRVSYLPLSKARKDGALQEFVAQEEARGIPPADQLALQGLIRKALPPPKEPQPANQTSHSRRVSVV